MKQTMEHLVVAFVFWLLSLPFVATFTINWRLDDNFDHTFSIPVVLMHPTGDNSTVNFLFQLRDTALLASANTFCADNNIADTLCVNLYEVAVKKRYDFLEKKMLEDQLAQNLSVINTQFIPNPHLARRTIAASAEIDNHFRANDAAKTLEDEVGRAYLKVLRILQSELSRNNPAVHEWRSVSNIGSSKGSYQFRPDVFLKHQLQLVIIHSCSFKEEKSRVLLSILATIQSSGLLDQRVHVVVLNYGDRIEHSSAVRSFFQHPRIHEIHVSQHVTFFEIPTLIIMHRLSRQLRDHYHMPLTQLLYLHTKGVSYKTVYPQIEDWREFMLYFLVERHRMCYHLLASGEIDAVGANFRSVGRDFRGNFWWVTAQYLSTLAPLSLEAHGKYDAEQWMLTASHVVRVFNAHESVVDHHKDRYERSKYVNGLSFRNPSVSPFPNTSDATNKPLRWFDSSISPHDTHPFSYCRTKRLSWGQTNDLLLTAVTGDVE